MSSFLGSNQQTISEALKGLTVGQVATIINAGIGVVHFSLSLFLAIVLVLVLRNSNTSLAWSSISRSLHSSLWPTLLRSDSSQTAPPKATNPGIRRIEFLGLLGTVGSLLITIAGVITPLGLGSKVVQSSHRVSRSANYIADNSPLGLATPARTLYHQGRLCSNGMDAGLCPYQAADSNISNFRSEIPERTWKPFVEASENGNSTAGQTSFGMQWRNFYTGTYNNVDRGGELTMGLMSMIDSQILREDAFAIEGLIVDMDTERPGVGLWNSSIPNNLDLGGAWEERILFLSPETSCVDTNLSFHYTLLNTASTPVENMTLVDHGGFWNLATEYPALDRDGQNIQIHQHAYKGAALINRYMMYGLGNITRNASYEGREFPLKVTNFTEGAIGTMQLFPFLAATRLFPSVEGSDLDGYTSEDVNLGCRGFGGGDIINLTNVAVDCGFLLGPSDRLDKGDSRLPEAHTTWAQSLHVCASTTRANIETVTFTFNGSKDLSDLVVQRRPENDLINQVPILWAMEKYDRPWNLSEVDPYWGRIAEDSPGASSPDLLTYSSPKFYPPAGSTSVFEGLDTSLQASVLPVLVWQNVHGKSIVTSWQSKDKKLFDYSGAQSFALMQKWRSLWDRDNEGGATKINNLIWTDVMAQNLVGLDSLELRKNPDASLLRLVSDDANSKRLSKRAGSTTAKGPSSTLLVFPRSSQITYQWVYGIPGFILLAICTPVIVAALGGLIFRTVRFDDLRYLINQTSLGRILTSDSDLTMLSSSTPPVRIGSHDDGHEKLVSSDTTSTSSLQLRHAGSRLTTKEWSKSNGRIQAGFSTATDVNGIPTLRGYEGSGKDGTSLRAALRKIRSEANKKTAV